MFKFSAMFCFLSVFGLSFSVGAVAADEPDILYAPVEVDIDDTQVHVRLGERTILEPYDGDHAIDLFSFPMQEDDDEAVCDIDYSIEEAEGGFDIIFTLSNSQDEPAFRPDVSLSGFRMESNVETRRDDEGRLLAYIDSGFSWLDARDIGRVRPTMRRWSPQRYQYPNDLYSPVMAAWDSEIAVGVSLIYDPWEVKHNLLTEYTIRGGRLFMRYILNAPLTRTVPGDYKAKLPPGETAQYRIAVRFAHPEPDREPHPGWLDALEPYRQHFVDNYGRVRYQRDLRPVMGQPVGQGNYLHEEKNPRGFHTGFGGERVDLDGWGPFTDWLREKVLLGYRRVMVWAPSGMYLVGSNYPTEFMTELPEKLVETMPELMSLKEDGVTVGMWWGRASQVSGGWNTGEMWVRDVSDPSDVQAAWDELDLAREYGVDEVGLDAFGYPHLWDRYEFLKEMRERYPEMNLITEAADCDIMHTVAPTFMTFDRQNQPPALADWLVSGHESWIMLRWQQGNEENFNKITGWDCVPVTMSRSIEHDASKFEGPHREK